MKHLSTASALGSHDALMTPAWVLDLVRQVGPIAVDPCAAMDPRHHFAKVNLTGGPGEDGMARDWTQLAEGGLVFVNPPYGRGHPPRWAAKVAREAEAGAEVIALLPVSMGSNWWQDHLAPRVASLCFLRGRVVFLDPSTGKLMVSGGTFDSVVAYFGRRPAVFEQAFAARGWIVLPPRQAFSRQESGWAAGNAVANG